MKCLNIPYYIGDIVSIDGKDYKITMFNIRQSGSSPRNLYYEADALDGSETGYGFFFGEDIGFTK